MLGVQDPRCSLRGLLPGRCSLLVTSRSSWARGLRGQLHVCAGGLGSERRPVLGSWDHGEGEGRRPAAASVCLCRPGG